MLPPVDSVLVFTSDRVLATARWVLSVAVRVKLYSRDVENSVLAPMFRRGTPTLHNGRPCAASLSAHQRGRLLAPMEGSRQERGERAVGRVWSEPTWLGSWRNDSNPQPRLHQRPPPHSKLTL